jgi:hypothetical protein
MSVLRWAGYVALGIVGLVVWDVIVSWREARQHQREDEKWERRLGIKSQLDRYKQETPIDGATQEEYERVLEAERDRYKVALEEIVQLAGKPNLQIVRASLIAQAALDQQEES